MSDDALMNPDEVRRILHRRRGRWFHALLGLLSLASLAAVFAAPRYLPETYPATIRLLVGLAALLLIAQIVGLLLARRDPTVPARRLLSRFRRTQTADGAGPTEKVPSDGDALAAARVQGGTPP